MKKWTFNLKKKKIEITIGRWDPKLGHYDLKRVDWEDEYEVKPPWYCFYTNKYEWGERELYAELLRFHVQVSIVDEDTTKLQRRRER
jgi:hypothetical protein